MTKVVEHLRDELEASNLPWEVKRGKRHLKLFVAGRLAGIFPGDGKSCGDDRRTQLNVRSQMRRIIKEETEAASAALH